MRLEEFYTELENGLKARSTGEAFDLARLCALIDKFRTENSRPPMDTFKEAVDLHKKHYETRGYDFSDKEDDARLRTTLNIPTLEDIESFNQLMKDLQSPDIGMVVLAILALLTFRHPLMDMAPERHGFINTTQCKLMDMGLESWLHELKTPSKL